MREKTVSCKTISLAVVLVLVLVLSAFTLVGCGEVSAETLQETYDTFETQVEKLRTDGVLTSDADGSEFGVATSYVVSYGTDVNSYISLSVRGNSDYDEYGELKTTYNSMIVVATDYFESAMANVFAIIGDGVSSDLQSSVKALNSSIEDCYEYFSTFTYARDSLISHFSSSSTATSDGDLAALGQFKKIYGAFVEKFVSAAASAADFIDASGTMSLISSTDPTYEDVCEVQKYVSIKIEQVFCHILLTEVGNKITWSSTFEGADKSTIDTLLTEYETLFADYQTRLVSYTSKLTFPQDGDSAETTQSLYEDLRAKVKSVLSSLDDFMDEIEDFETALSGLDIATLATDYSNDLTKYLAANEFAQIYIDKLEQFVSFSLPYFIDSVVTTLALSEN